MFPPREYVSLEQRARQREQSKLECRQRWHSGSARACQPRQGQPGVVATVTDEQLARNSPWADNRVWADIGTAMTTMTRTFQDMTNAISTTALTNFVGLYDDMVYTTTFTTSTNDAIRWGGWNTSYVETEEARARRAEYELERARQIEEANRQAEERRRAYREAERVARDLLLAHLDAQQKRTMLAHGWFEVISNTGRRWRIRTDGYAGNVDLMPADAGSNLRLASYCAHSPESLPLSDHHLIQKIVLEADEAAFLAVANLNYFDQARYGDPELIPDRRRELRAMRDHAMRDPLAAGGLAG